MKWILLALVVGIAVSWLMSRQRQKRAAELEATRSMDRLRQVTDEDVTRFGEELTGLHMDALTSELDAPMRQDYQRALDSYDNAKMLLHDAQKPDDITAVTRTLEDGRYALACVQARAAGEPLPTRRPPCFFNPAHGPAQTDVTWAPAGGEGREIPVCLADADRLANGAEPDTRQVRRGNQMVPWYQGGPGYAPYAGGYYGGYALNGLFPGFILGSMMFGGFGGDGSYADGFSDGQESGGDSGGDGGGDSGGDGGGDYGGGDFGGGGDWGGGDFGGGDFGGF
jgi:uncharacterized membrane-anchored protein YhcB (DUF1043 family)